MLLVDDAARRHGQDGGDKNSPGLGPNFVNKQRHDTHKNGTIGKRARMGAPDMLCTRIRAWEITAFGRNTGQV